MEKLLHEIKILPGVVGAFVYMSKTDSVVSELPKMMQDKPLNQIGSALVRVFKLNEKADLSVNGMELKFDESHIIAKQVDDDSSLIVLCEPETNIPLVNMTTSMLVSDLKNAIANPPQPQAVPQAPTPSAPPPEQPPAVTLAPEPPPAAPKAVNVDQILQQGPMAQTFSQFQDALARAIGPIGNMVMKEAVEKWAKEGNVSQARLKDLARVLCVEIGNDDLEKEFLAEINHLF